MIGSAISHYKITSKLGEGGMGVVYKAEDTKLERPVALKFLPDHLLGDPDVRKRFEREAKAAASVQHSNICTVFEIDEVDGKTFIAMAFLEGEPLDQRIARGPLKVEEALDISLQIAKGLEAAHSQGVVHRDIKPQNVMVDSQGQATIMDFGLAQLAEVSRLTRVDTTVGTVSYMSPEQTQGTGMDLRTDIWALGVVIYEMVTGQKPFKGDYDQAVIYSILNEEPESVTGLRTGVPVQLEQHVAKALAKRAEDRYQNASDIIVDLRTLAAKMASGLSMAAVTAASAPATQATVTAARTVHIDDVGADRDARLKRQKQIDGFLAGGMIIFASGIGTSIFLYFLIPNTPLFLTGVIPMLVGAAFLGLAYLMAKRPSE